MADSTGKKLAKSTSGLRMVPTSENFSSPFALEEPAWIPDKEVPRCTNCDRNFDFLNRRHHCRRCGKCFCNPCCSHNILLQRMYFVDPVRHCYECAVVSKSEEEFYGKGLKVLTEGSQQRIKNEISEDEPAQDLGIYQCKLTADHRSIEFLPGKSSPESGTVPSAALLTNVMEAEVTTESHSPPGKKTGNILRLKYKDCSDTSVVHCVIFRPVNQKSIPWLVCANKALKMTFESRNQRIHE